MRDNDVVTSRIHPADNSDDPPWGRPGFTLREARAADPDHPLRHRYLIPTRGLRVGKDADLSLPDWLRLLRAVLPAEIAFSHATAAAMWGLPVPWGCDPAAPVHVIRPTHCPPIRRVGVSSHRGIGTRDIDVRDGLPVTTLADTWCDLAASWSRPALVAAGDVLVRDHPEQIGTLQALVASLGGCRGVRTLRELLPLLRAGSASPKESEARLLFHDAGLPEPELNVDLHDEWDRWLARPDFVWRDKRVLAEYDGDQHRTDRSVWQYERQRRARLEDAGWTYIEMTATSLSQEGPRTELLARLRRALR